MSHWRELASQAVRGHRWITAMDVLQAAVDRASLLSELGATEVFAIGASVGTGPIDEAIPHHVLGVKGKGMMNAIRKSEAAFDDLPDDARARVEAFDPTGAAKVYRVFFSTGKPVAERATFGARPAAWQALEDKTVIDAVWDEAGVPRAPYALATPQAIDRSLDQGDGVVFSGDMREGFNGGASYVRWVRDDAELEQARAFYLQHCDRVRAVPFLEGLPCSIHAFVTADELAVFRPCEMLVFRRPGEITFQYASVATVWRPDQHVVDEMRSFARTVALHLRERYGYRGVFTIDGVLTAEGFRPTELNPRIGAGIGPLLRGLDIPLELLHFAAIEGLELDWRLDELEQLVLESPSSYARGGVLVPNACAPRDTRFRQDGERFVEDEHGPIQVVLGQAPGAAGYLRLLTDQLTPGPPVGPLFVELVRQLDRDWALGIGPLEAATLPT